MSGPFPDLRFGWVLPGSRPEGFHAQVVESDGVAVAAGAREALFVAGAAVRAVDLSPLGLAEGEHVVELTAVDAYGSESEPRTLRVRVGAGGVPGAALAGAFELSATAAANATVQLAWFTRITRDAATRMPEAWEIAGPQGGAGGDAVLVTVPVVGRALQFQAVATPAEGHAAEVVLRLRATGGGEVGPWLPFPAVVLDGVPPSVPSIICG